MFAGFNWTPTPNLLSRPFFPTGYFCVDVDQVHLFFGSFSFLQVSAAIFFFLF
jgi:hypothetical protein